MPGALPPIFLSIHNADAETHLHNPYLTLLSVFLFPFILREFDRAVNGGKKFCLKSYYSYVTIDKKGKEEIFREDLHKGTLRAAADD